MSANTSPSSRTPRSVSDDVNLTGGLEGERDVLRALSRGLTPDPLLTVSEWATGTAAYRPRRALAEIWTDRGRLPNDRRVILWRLTPVEHSVISFNFTNADRVDFGRDPAFFR